MASNPEALRQTLQRMIRPESRGRLLARGLARGMIWKHGSAASGSPPFAQTLTADLLDFGYVILALAFEIRETHIKSPQEEDVPADVFRVAAEAIEAAARGTQAKTNETGRHLLVSAAAFHIGGFAARAYSLLAQLDGDPNLSSVETALRYLLVRDIAGLRRVVVAWQNDGSKTDDVLAARIADEDDSFSIDDALFFALSSSYFRALGRAESALYLGDPALYRSSIGLLTEHVEHAASVGNVPIWWNATLTLHVLRDLWGKSLHISLPEAPHGGEDRAEWAALRRDFIHLMSARTPPQIDLWPSQLAAAARATDPHDDLVIALPTSAGKTRIAEICIVRTFAQKKRTVYVTPLRALSAQVERVLARTFVPLGAEVTSLYGAAGTKDADAATLANADIVVATPEKLDFALRQDPSVLDDVGLVVFDEGHMIGLGSREIRYEALIQRLLRREDADSRRIVCLSAMFRSGDESLADFGRWLRRDKPGDLVQESWRPTRRRLATLEWNAHTNAAELKFLEGERPYLKKFFNAQPPKGKRKLQFPKDEKEFIIATALAYASQGSNVLIYSPSRKSVEPLVREFAKSSKQGYLEGIRRPTDDEAALALAIGKEWLGDTHPAVEGLRLGIAAHHGSLPRPFLTAIEDMLFARKLPVVVASPTLAQGVDLACGVLLFSSLHRGFDTVKKKPILISPAEFSNVLGRVGRAYVDLDGFALLPSFTAGYQRTANQKLFNELITNSGGLRLRSGLAQLVWAIAGALREALGVDEKGLLEHVVNQQELWSETVAAEEAQDPEEDDEVLSQRLADLDVAILSLMENLETPVEELADALDTLLEGSLWQRTLAHTPAETQTLERAILIARAQWIWSRTSSEQRQACFQAGLGATAGVFVYDNLQEILHLLMACHKAIVNGDSAALGPAVCSFAAFVFGCGFFKPRALPPDWIDVLSKWVGGVAFAEILRGRPEAEKQVVQVFVQDFVVYKLAWAVEAARAQADSRSFLEAAIIGDGPTLSLTYGAPTIAAALLCRHGFASRVGAIWAVQSYGGTFEDAASMNAWLDENESDLSNRKLWPSSDLWLMWRNGNRRTNGMYPRRWTRRKLEVTAKWGGPPPKAGQALRVIPAGGRGVQLCDLDLRPLGTAMLSFDPNGELFLTASVLETGRVAVRSFRT